MLKKTFTSKTWCEGACRCSVTSVMITSEVLLLVIKVASTIFMHWLMKVAMCYQTAKETPVIDWQQ